MLVNRLADRAVGTSPIGAPAIPPAAVQAAAAVVAEGVEVGEVAEADAAVVEAETMNTFADKVGLGWRADLAAGIFSHLDRIDLLEIVADDFFDAPRREIRALQTLAAQVSVVLHGVG